MKWTKEEYNLHLKAVKKISRIKEEAFALITERLKNNEKLTDYQVQKFILKRFNDLDLVSDAFPPIVAVNKNSSAPHYIPSAQNKTYIKKGSWVLIDIWAKEKVKNGIFSDITWVGYVGKTGSEKYQKIFDLVVKARDSSLRFLERKLKRGEKVAGWEVDQYARDIIRDHGLGKYFIHNLGHSLGYKVHAPGVAFKSLKKKDRGLIRPGQGFAIEPGIYLEDFGVRSEINIFVETAGVKVTTPGQKEILRL